MAPSRESVHSLLLAACLLTALAVIGCGSSSSEAAADRAGNTPSCPRGEVPCGPECVELASSAEHCGACGNSCDDGAFCHRGQCLTDCPSGQTRCSDRCVDLSASGDHCGACGAPCADGQVCREGVCADSCGGRAPAQCGTSCVQLDRDVSHCGACDQRCPLGKVCSSGRCDASCGGDTPLQCDGLCVDPLTDPLHCGACGHACPPGLVCSEGQCGESCGGRSPDRCGDLCVDTQRNVGFCGDCDTACSGGLLCVAGACASECAPSAPQRCGLSCVATWSDPYHCGACNRTCDRSQVCNEGSCQTSCSGSTPLQCGDRCVDPRTDPAACGACGNACGKDQVCSRGACRETCGKGERACGGACVDSSNDPRHCGGCGLACVPGAVCAHGVCSSRCPASRPTACGSQCADLQADPFHCGACNQRCPSAQSCQAGECRCPVDAPDLCGGTCVATQTDPSHCGACGQACGERQECVAGECRNTIGLVETGWQGTCALYGAGEVRCWGPSHPLTGAAEPAPGNSIDWIEGFSGPILDVDVGGNHACALLATGSVECWGSNGIEFLLGTSGGSSAHPVRADLPAGAAVRLWVDYNRAAALLSDGSLWTWGMNPWGELAHAGAAPAPAEGLGGTPVDVGGGQSHMCARFADEHTTVRCWGLEQAIYGGNSFAQLAPTTIAGLTAADAGVDLSQALAVGDSFTCALEGAGAVACWGSNSQGQLGTPPADLASSATPVAVSGLPSRAEALIAGQVFACALLDNRQLWCWGQHVGNGGYAPTGPEKILEDVITATAEGFAAFARVSNGTWYSWGNGSSLVLGRIYGETLRPGRCCEW